MTDIRTVRAVAFIGEEQSDDRSIRHAELDRARRALAYLRGKLGNDAMWTLLDDDLRTMAAKVRGWVEASRGTWQSAALRMAVPGSGAQAFQDWLVAVLAGGREAELRAGHPEPVVSHPVLCEVEVVESIGETALPWRVFCRAVPENFVFPVAWDPAYALHHRMEIVDTDGLRIGFSLRQSRNEADGLHLQFTIPLPLAAPGTLVRRHLNRLRLSSATGPAPPLSRPMKDAHEAGSLQAA